MEKELLTPKSFEDVFKQLFSEEDYLRFEAAKCKSPVNFKDEKITVSFEDLIEFWNSGMTVGYEANRLRNELYYAMEHTLDFLKEQADKEKFPYAADTEFYDGIRSVIWDIESAKQKVYERENQK